MKKNDSNSMMPIMAIAVLGLVAALIVFSAKTSDVNITTDGQPVDKSIISVLGQYQLEVEPDEAYVTLTIETKGATATIAQADNKISTNKVLDALEAEGIDEGDIETTGYYLYPQRRWDYDTQKYTDEGYTQTHTLKVTIKDVEDAGAVIDAAVRAGVNQISNIQFTLSDDLREEKEAEALEMAAEEARSKADAIAGSLGTRIIKISRVSESNVYSQPYYYADRAYAVAEGAAMDYEETTISPEDVTVTARISIEYVIDG